MKDGGPGTILGSTRAWCARCGDSEHALIAARGDGVYLERLCPQQGTVAVLIARDRVWYQARTAQPRAMVEHPGAAPLRHGCPRDCGPCQCHTARLHLPVISITNLCNLDCPICFTYNRPDRAYCMSRDELAAIVAELTAAGPIELINLTGGEPTLHPELFTLLDLCRASRIGRITMNSNGLKIAADPVFARGLKERGVQVVLSLDTLDAQKSVVIHGRDITAEKRAALARLEELAIPTTLLIVCIKGVNEAETGELVRRYLAKPFVRGITIQNMTFTGQNGSRFEPREHVTLDEVEDLLVAHGDFGKDDFFPLGAYHPLCYSAAYYLADGERLLSLTRLVEGSLLTAATTDSYVLDGGEELAAALRAGIDRLWAAGEDEATLALLRRFIRELYPPGGLSQAERRQRAETLIRMVYIHPHMDADNFDLARVSHCGDLVPDESGALVPACAYNLLYRQRDPRFWVESP